MNIDRMLWPSATYPIIAFWSPSKSEPIGQVTAIYVKRLEIKPDCAFRPEFGSTKNTIMLLPILSSDGGCNTPRLVDENFLVVK